MDHPAPGIVAGPAGLCRQRFRDFDSQPRGSIELPSQCIRIPKHRDFAARPRPHRTEMENTTRPFQRKAVNGLIVLRPCEADRFSLAPEVAFPGPGRVYPRTTCSEPDADLLYL